MAPEGEQRSSRRAEATREILLYGLAGGILIVVVETIETRFLRTGSSLGLYGALIACLFTGVGIWLGASLRRKQSSGRHERQPASPTEATPFVPDEERSKALGLTPRELEILATIAAGLSNREIAAKLFVSENTVKTHTSRLFSKLGARRRTEAVKIGRANGLIP